MTVETLKDSWLKYARIWSETDETIRVSTLTETITSTCIYTDPNTQTKGVSELSAYMGECQKQFPGLKFETVEFVEHHGRSLAKWKMLANDSQVIGEGASFVKYGKKGMLEEMTGFFEN